MWLLMIAMKHIRKNKKVWCRHVFGELLMMVKHFYCRADRYVQPWNVLWKRFLMDDARDCKMLTILTAQVLGISILHWYNTKHRKVHLLLPATMYWWNWKSLCSSQQYKHSIETRLSAFEPDVISRLPALVWEWDQYCISKKQYSYQYLLGH